MKAAALGSSLGRILIGGHRGCGENLISVFSNGTTRVEPAYRENTLLSFQRAADLGVSFVELDVQVTRDGVPVIWHDDSIITKTSSQSIDTFEVKDKRLDEFRALVLQEQDVEGGSPRTNLVRAFRNRDTRQEMPGLSPWECQRDDILPTLEQLFKTLPEDVGVDVEVKMTVPDTVAVTPPEEVERVVRPILACVEQHASTEQGAKRPIFYSSFDPDVCVKLAREQSRYPVFYLSGCGLYPHVDPRRTSIPAAISFASEHRLAGIVLPASILMANVSLVAEATERGLKVLTYGLENNQVEVVSTQQQLGVHAAIVDDVESTLPQLKVRVSTDARQEAKVAAAPVTAQ